MNLVALESSTHLLSAALWCDGVIRERSEDLPNAGSQHLLPWLNDLLADTGATIDQVDAIAFGSGPGGFVGLRLACALAQGLATGLGVPVIAVGTLEALALASGGSDVYVCQDARMGEVYAAAYRIVGEAVSVVVPPGVFLPDAVPVPLSWPWLGAGDGFKTHGDSLRRRLTGTLLDVRADCAPTAAAVVRIAAERWRSGIHTDAADALPTYVRDAVALTTEERLARGGRR